MGISKAQGSLAFGAGPDLQTAQAGPGARRGQKGSNVTPLHRPRGLDSDHFSPGTESSQRTNFWSARVPSAPIFARELR